MKKRSLFILIIIVAFLLVLLFYFSSVLFNKYYTEKLLEKYKYDALMEMDKDIVKLYFVADPKGNYLFWLNDIVLPKIEERYCPSTTLWSNKKELKEVYLIKETQASRINWND